MKSLPSLLGLVAFDAVARNLSFSKAAKELHVTQAAISHRIRSLEDELGVSLFARTSRKVQLTLPGQTLFRSTERAFRLLQNGLSEMNAVANPRRITVSCSPSFAIRWLVPHLGEFREHSPDLELHIAAEDRIRTPGVEGIDTCIRFGVGGYSGVACELLSDEMMGPVCSPFMNDFDKMNEPSDLQGFVLLHDEVLADHEAHIGWRAWFALHDLKSAALPGPRFSHSHMALDAAIAQQGVALARQSLVRRELANGSLVAPFGFEVRSGFSYWLITASDVSPTPAVLAFRDWLLSAAYQQTVSPRLSGS